MKDGEIDGMTRGRGMEGLQRKKRWIVAGTKNSNSESEEEERRE